MKRTSLLFTLALAAAISTGCGSGGGSTKPSPVPTPSPTPNPTPSVSRFAGCFRFTGQSCKTGAAQAQSLMTSIPLAPNARTNHTATLLPDGTVLVAGGFDAAGNVLSTAEIFDPTTESFTEVSGTMAIPRADQAAVLVPISGVVGPINRPNPFVLLIGGRDGNNTIDMFDAVTKTFLQSFNLPFAASSVGAGTDQDMKAYSLGDGRVVVIGGHLTAISTSAAQPAVLLDFRRGSITASTDQIRDPNGLLLREHGASVQLADGRIMVTGGSNDPNVPCTDDIVIFNLFASAVDPTTTLVGHLATPRCKHAMSLLSDGSVAVYGGVDAAGNSLSSVERVQLDGTTSIVGNMPAARSLITSIQLSTGTSLIIGGDDATGTAVGTQLIFDHNDNTSGVTGALQEARVDYAALPLTNGLVLISGGKNSTGVSGTAEIFDPQNAVSLKYPSSQVAITVDPVAGPVAGTILFRSVLPVGTTVTWSATSGTIVDNGDGTATYTPPIALDMAFTPPHIDPSKQILSDVITITSVQNPSVKAEAPVSITYTNPL